MDSEFDFDVTYRREANGTTGGVAWRAVRFAKDETEPEFSEDQFDEWLDEIYEEVLIGSLKYRTSYAMKEVDPIAYRESFNDYINFQMQDYEYPDDESLVVCVMTGDNREFTFDVDELVAISDDDYCAECGQIGCGATEHETEG